MIVADVAAASSRSARSVAGEPFFWTLYELLHLRRREVRDARTRDSEGLRAAWRTNYAFAAPEQLQAEAAAMHAGAERLPSHEAAKAQGAKTLQAAIAAGWLADPGTPPEVPHA